MAQPYLIERFAGPSLHTALRWHCEPSRWTAGDGRLRLEPDAGTDFWQRTHYGFRADNGHALLADVAGDFIVSTQVQFQPVHQYDQAGLLVRISPSCWLKTSVEHEPGRAGRLGAVVTNDAYSDWSTQPFPVDVHQVWLRVRRQGQDYIVDAARDGRDWEQIRMARLHEDREGLAVRCGLYACSPKAAGFVAAFGALTLERGRLA
jgi:regulation of enolase protein 1 (concanavalin A-like superfamily)